MEIIFIHYELYFIALICSLIVCFIDKLHFKIYLFLVVMGWNIGSGKYMFILKYQYIFVSVK